jgi:hypothetical protein
LSIDEQKELLIPIENPKTKKIEKVDYSDLNEFFKKHLIDLDNRLNPKSAQKEENLEENSSDISEADMLSQIVDDSDDLPF